MKNPKIVFRLLSAIVVFALAAFVVSCSQDASQVGSTEKASVTSEASTDSYFEDAEDLSASASNSSDADLGGRSTAGGLKDRDPRFACATITIKKLNTGNPDTIIIDFGTTGCTDPKGNVRKGKIIITFTGSRTALNSTVTTTFDGFFVNGNKIEGTRTVKLYAYDNTSVTHEITLTGGKITFAADNSSATRDAHHFRKWVLGSTLLDITDDQILLLTGGTASGTNREGKSYEMQITKDITFKAECRLQKFNLPASGTKVLTIGNAIITVDYGNDSCDNTVTITVNGESKEVTVTRG